MCGILGIINRDRSTPNRQLLEAMTARLTHRGPDTGDLHTEQGVGLGHRRLQVIDLEGGRQPMRDAESGCVLVYNGEVYNFLKLRTLLEGEGYRFTTGSDTEVVLSAYLRWGTECVHRFNGMFALAVWDPKKRSLFLARDRMGQKPLYYTHTPGVFLFGSEPKALAPHPEFSREVNLEALDSYLLYEYVPAPLSIFEGTRKLSPGTWAVLDTESWELEEKTYWTLPFPIDHRYDDTPEDSASARLKGALEESVAGRLVSHVPLGVFLSGGLDSSALTALMCRHREASTVDTFSIGFQDPSFDESSHARRVAGFLGTRHHEKILEPGTVLELLPRLAEIMDEPFGDASIVPTFLLSRFARESVTVVLGGDGGDELFAGYPTFQAEQAARWLYDPMPSPITRLMKGMGCRLPVSTRNISFDFKVKQFLKGADWGNLDRHAVWLGSFSPEEIGGLLHPAIRDTSRQHTPLQDLQDKVSRDLPSNRDDALISYYCRSYLSEDILVKVDRASMAVGLEARAPFLDPAVVELACNLPPRFRIRGLTTKYILKKAASELIPKEILNRPKKGFGIPVARWIKKELRPLMDHLLNRRRLEAQQLFHPPAVDRLIQEHLRGKKDNRKQLWTLMAFQLWWDTHGPHPPTFLV